MQRTRLLLGSSLVAAVTVVLLAGCTIRTNDSAEKGGKKVDIETPMGSLHVRNEADARDTGMSVYPGATLKKKEDGDERSAHVNIDTSMFGLKVVAITYETTDAPDKVLDYYKKELIKWGKVLECHSNSDVGRVVIHKGKDKDSDELTCDKHGHGDTVELKVGVEHRQHVVAVKPRGQGSEFSLVYVQTRKEGETI